MRKRETDRLMWKGDSGPYIFTSYDGKEAFADLSCWRPTGSPWAPTEPNRPSKKPSYDYSSEAHVLEVGMVPESYRLLRGLSLIFPREER